MSNSNVERGYSELSNLIYNDRSFVNFELSLVKVVMYLLIFISDVDIVRLFINKSGIIQQKILISLMIILKQGFDIELGSLFLLSSQVLH